MLKFVKKNLPLTLAYLILSVIFTYPQILHVASGCVEPSIGGSNDQYLLMWDVWWVKKALFELGTSPYYTDLLNYPAGASLALSEIGLLNGILLAPFQIFLDKPHGLVFGYNVGIALSFLISALTMYALAFEITRSRQAAFIAGIAFAFMPYRMMHITQLNLLSTGWIPLYILFLTRVIRSPMARNVVWVPIFFALTFHSSFVYGFFLILFSGAFVFAHILVDYKGVLCKPVLKRLGIVVALCGIVLLPNVIMILSAGISWSQPPEISDMFSANLAGYLFPSGQQAIYRFLVGHLPPFQYYISGVPGDATFVTFTLLALFVYGIVKTSKKEVLPWLIIFVVFLILSLGPTLHVLKWATTIKLPYLVLSEYFPFFSALRTPYRLVVLERIALIIVATYGMKHFFSLYDSASVENAAGTERTIRQWKLLASAGLSLLLIAELSHVPFKYVEADVPEVYFEISKREGDFVVVDLPISRYRDVAKYMFYQTVHEKPIPVGIINRPEADLTETTGEIISMLREADRIDPGMLETLRRYGAGFVILHDFREGRDRVITHKLL